MTSYAKFSIGVNKQQLAYMFYFKRIYRSNNIGNIILAVIRYESYRIQIRDSSQCEVSHLCGRKIAIFLQVHLKLESTFCLYQWLCSPLFSPPGPFHQELNNMCFKDRPFSARFPHNFEIFTCKNSNKKANKYWWKPHRWKSQILMKISISMHWSDFSEFLYDLNLRSN